MSITPAGLDTKALEALRHSSLDDSHKGVPLGVTTTLAEVASHGWNVAAGDLSLPVTTLDAESLESNLQVMAEYCRRHQVSFAPHGKTTMSPQLFDRQLRAGAWALTCATPTQAAIMRRYGASRIIVANEITEPGAWRWLVKECAADPTLCVLSLVDSVAAVEHIDSTLEMLSPDRPADVLLEIGVSGGRAGVRTRDEAFAVAKAVLRSAHLQLVGLEAYEGLVTSGGDAEDLAALDDFMARVRQVVVDLSVAGLLNGPELIVTAGGSAYFDRVVGGLVGWDDVEESVRVVLRSGCYVSHDAGKYHRLSPLDGRAAAPEDLRLKNALTAWASVLSRPEPELVIVGTGKRDVAHDLTLPAARTLHPATGGEVDLRGRTETFKLMDQHAFLRVPTDLAIGPGDVVAFDLNHPCTAFDKTTFVPIIDRDNVVVDAVRTFF